MLQVFGNDAIVTAKEIEKKNNVNAPQIRHTIQYKKKVEYYPLPSTMLHAFTKGTGAFSIRTLGGRVFQSFAVEYSNSCL